MKSPKEQAINDIMNSYFVITPEKDNDGGDVWGMDTSLGTIKEIREAIGNKIDIALQAQQKEFEEKIRDRDNIIFNLNTELTENDKKHEAEMIKANDSFKEEHNKHIHFKRKYGTLRLYVNREINKELVVQREKIFNWFMEEKHFSTDEELREKFDKEFSEAKRK